MAEAGMDIARLNFSHEDYEEHSKRMHMIKNVSEVTGRRIAILQDLPGPKIRLGDIIAEPLILKKGLRVKIIAGLQRGRGKDAIPMPYDKFAEAVYPGCEVYLWDGASHLVVESIDGNEVNCVVEVGGPIYSKKGVNIPKISRGLDVITEEDIKHMAFGVKAGVDYIALSFVRSADDIREARRILKGFGRVPPIIAKMEKQDALNNYKEIISAADAIMVARGDLGVEIGIENVPLAQKMMLKESVRQHKPSITATQMLFSMIKNKTPTRAEVSDVANAILDGSDALMLSEETAVGEYYTDAVSVLDRIARRIEKERKTELEKRCGWLND
jgi:pyruvate kinase